MKYTIAILKEVKIMNNLENQTNNFSGPWLGSVNRFFIHSALFRWFKDDEKVLHPFRVILNKEISDHLRSWRFIILIAIITQPQT